MVNQIIPEGLTDVIELPLSVLRKTVFLTDEQIRTLPTTPVEIIPAPGERKLIYIQSAIFHRPPFGGAYVGHSDGDDIELAFTYSSAGNGGFYRDDTSGNNDLNILLGENPEDEFTFLDLPKPIIFAGYYRPRLLSSNGANVNLPVYLKAVTLTGEDFTGGHPDNFIEVTVFYSVLDV